VKAYWHAEYYDYDGGGSDYVMYDTKEEAKERVTELNKSDYGDCWGIAVTILVKRGQEKEAEELWDKMEAEGILNFD